MQYNAEIWEKKIKSNMYDEDDKAPLTRLL